MSIFGGDDKPSSSSGTQQSQYERALATRAATDWNDYVTRFAPVEDSVVRLTSNTDARRRRAMDDAASTAIVQSGWGSRGVADAVAAGRAANTGATTRETISKANVYRRGLGAAAGAVEPALYEMKQRGRLKVAANLRGLQDAATISMGQLAQDATRNAITDAQSDMARRNAWLEAGFGAAGMAAAANFPSLKGIT
jgi:hypothetical protein